MQIRKATYHDAPAIKLLLDALGYKARISLLVDQLERLFGSQDHEVFVYELKTEVVAFASVHYLPQLAFDGGIAIISYFSVDPAVNDTGVAKELERYITERARFHRCERIQVHCLEWRAPVHHFYMQQGYQEYPKYFTKRIIYAE